MADLEALQKTADEAEQALSVAVQKRDTAVDELAAARVESYDEAVVAEAQRVGVNPANFDKQGAVEAAIEQQLQEHPELQLPQEPEQGQTESPDVPV